MSRILIQIKYYHTILGDIKTENVYIKEMGAFLHIQLSMNQEV